MPKKPAKSKAAKPAKKSKPGPAPAVLKLEGNWMDNIAKSFKAKKPAGGWPK